MKTIAILAPRQEELDALVRFLPPVVHTVFHGLELLTTEFQGQNLVLMRSGVGKVNTTLHDRFGEDRVACVEMEGAARLVVGMLESH